MNHVVKITKEINAKIFGFKEADYNMQAMQIGGMCTFDMSVAMWDNLVAHCNLDAVETVFQHGLSTYILVYTDWLEEAGLIKAEYNAILLHEEGHIHHSHTSLNLGKAGIVCDATQELQADAYATDRVGKDILRSAIEKICHQVISDLVLYHNTDFDAAYEFIMSNAIVKMRLSVLRRKF